jgi:anti-anti-sigma factor
MKVKIDTKEKFHTITIDEPVLSANMTAELNQLCLSFLEQPVKNVILQLSQVEQIEDSIAEDIVAVQQTFYDNNCSFVICCLQKQVEDVLEVAELLETMNVTPTESEAWDMLQMEEIERELLDE